MRKIYFLIALPLLMMMSYMSTADWYSPQLNDTSDTTLIFYSPFDETGGATVYDNSTYKSNGTMLNFTFNSSNGWFNASSCVYGLSCLKFDGLSTILNVTIINNTFHTANVTNLTISTWVNTGGKVRPDGSGWEASQSIFNSNFASPTDDHYFKLAIVSANIVQARWWRYDGSTNRLINVQTTTGIPNNTWTHIGYVINGTDTVCCTGTLYINGESVATQTTLNWKSVRRVSENTIGAMVYGGNYKIRNSSFNGTIEDFRMFNRSLSDNEVKELFSCRMPNTSPWNMTANCNITDTNIDNSTFTLNIHGGNLTLTNSTLFVDTITIGRKGLFAIDNNSKWGMY